MNRPEDLILAPNVESFRVASRPLLHSPGEVEALVPGLLVETALRHYREEYPKHIPHALLALLGGLEARDLLDGPERAWPLVKALAYVSREKHFARFDPASVPARGDGSTLAGALADGDFPAAYGAARALADAGRADEALEVLLRDGAGDAFNLRHRFIFAAKVARRLRAGPDVDAAALLYPVVHYACLAPRDGSPGEGLGPEGDGRDPVRVTEDVFAEAIRRIPGALAFDWVPVAHVANYAEAAGWWAREGGSPERRRVPVSAESFLAEVARTLPEPRVGGAPAIPAPDPDRAAGALEAAIAARDPAAARAVAGTLTGPAGHRARLERSVLLGCARIDGGHAFSHDLKVAANAVRLSRAGLGERRPRCLPDLAAFLAGLPADGEYADILPPSR